MSGCFCTGACRTFGYCPNTLGQWPPRHDQWKFEQTRPLNTDEKLDRIIEILERAFPHPDREKEPESIQITEGSDT